MPTGRGVARRTKGFLAKQPAVRILHPASFGTRPTYPPERVIMPPSRLMLQGKEVFFIMSLSTQTPTTNRTIAKAALKRLVLGAMLSAVSVVIGMFCKSFLNFGEGLWRITFENLPIILAGVFLGPVTGGMVGIVSDLVSYLLSPQTYPPNLIVTLGAFMVGVVSGVMAKYVVRKRGTGQIILCASAAHVVGSMIIKPIGLFQFYQWAVLVRIPLYLVIAPVEIFLLCLLWRQKSFRKLFEKL